jgi:hypothetical protein
MHKTVSTFSHVFTFLQKVWPLIGGFIISWHRRGNRRQPRREAEAVEGFPDWGGRMDCAKHFHLPIPANTRWHLTDGVIPDDFDPYQRYSTSITI